MKVVCATRVGNMKDPNPETRGTVGIVDMPIKELKDDEVLIKVTGPAQVIGGRSYCVFSSDDGKAKVPFPATLSFITRNGATKTYDAGCDDSWRDMTDALWLTTPWTDISGEVGQMDKTTVKFSIPMDNAISLRTVDDNGWFGEVSASGEIHVQATWRNIN